MGEDIDGTFISSKKYRELIREYTIRRREQIKGRIMGRTMGGSRLWDL
jgi:hypothetical protein